MVQYLREVQNTHVPVFRSRMFGSLMEIQTTHKEWCRTAMNGGALFVPKITSDGTGWTLTENLFFMLKCWQRD